MASETWQYTSTTVSPGDGRLYVSAEEMEIVSYK